MSSMAFCSDTSGFSRPVDTSMLRTATALSFAIMVGLPTCNQAKLQMYNDDEVVWSQAAWGKRVGWEIEQ